MIIEEGLVKIIAPNVNLKGPGKKEGVFYNRDMVFNRDTSIFLLHNLKVKNALDGLAATGVRGIRFVKELDIPTTINDTYPEAIKIIKENIKMNKVNARITNKNVNTLMSEEKFEYIDIDPFGTPVPFIEMALLSGTILGITATDTATLGGRNKKIKKRYLADVQSPSPLVHEIGIRVLLGYVGRIAVNLNLGIHPLVSIWHGHFYRVYIIVRRERAKETAKNIGNCKFGGPVWIGDLHDFGFLKDAKIPDWIPTKSLLKKYLALWNKEEGLLFYHIPTLTSQLKISTPPLQKIMDELNNIGFYAHRTQFSPQGIRTNAPEEIVLELLKKYE